jgi:hypothetical protein
MLRLPTSPIGIVLLLTQAGCSIAMALNGNIQPNFEAFDVGSTRKQVEIQLGTPLSSKSLPDGNREDTYKYQMGNSPNGARATLYFYYDLVTFGLAEPVFSLIEVLQGHDEESVIIYDQDDRVLEIQGYRPPEPSPELKAARQEQEKHRQPGSK